MRYSRWACSLAVVLIAIVPACEYKQKLGAVVLSGNAEKVLEAAISAHNPPWVLHMFVSKVGGETNKAEADTVTILLKNEGPKPFLFVLPAQIVTIAAGQEIVIFSGSIETLGKQIQKTSPPWGFMNSERVKVQFRWKPKIVSKEQYNVRVSLFASDPLP